MLKIICNNSQYLTMAETLAQQLDLLVDTHLDPRTLPLGDIAIEFNNTGASLICIDEQKTGAVIVDFVNGKLGYRLRHNEAKPLIAKAIGIKPGVTPLVWDMTAGLGQDSFILAKLGCQVKMHERNPIVYCLLLDGLQRAQTASDQLKESVLKDVVNRLSISPADSLDVLSTTNGHDFDQKVEKPDVIYLDPMFPDRKKTAKVKKGMQVFHQLVGGDVDADNLLELAMGVAKNRVVVKRPKGAPSLSYQKPVLQFNGKSLRFDVYPLKKMGHEITLN